MYILARACTFQHREEIRGDKGRLVNGDLGGWEGVMLGAMDAAGLQPAFWEG